MGALVLLLPPSAGGRHASPVPVHVYGAGVDPYMYMYMVRVWNPAPGSPRCVLRRRRSPVGPASEAEEHLADCIVATIASPHRTAPRTVGDRLLATNRKRAVRETGGRWWLGYRGSDTETADIEVFLSCPRLPLIPIRTHPSHSPPSKQLRPSLSRFCFALASPLA